MRTASYVLIVLALAAVVAFAPLGGVGAEMVGRALSLAFILIIALGAIAFHLSPWLGWQVPKLGPLSQALAQGARVLLLITGRARPADDHSLRGERRGVIRAKFMDWLAAGPFASRIAAVRPAHPRHGGAGAVYLILRRAR